MLHYIPADELDEENLNRIVGTPHSLGLEVDAPAPVANEDEETEEVAMTPVEETEIPDSIPLTGLNEIFATETEEEYVDVMDMMDEDADEFDEDLFSDC